MRDRLVPAALLSGLLLLAVELPAQIRSPNLVARLGHPPGTRLLMVNADDAGLLHAGNAATIASLDQGIVGSTTVMTVAPWFPEIAAYARTHRDKAIGVHLTFTSEWPGIRYGPVLGRGVVPSLVDSLGYFQKDLGSFAAHAVEAEVEAEGRAQIRRALDAGIDVSHLDAHMHALGRVPRLFDVLVRLAVEFDLPVRFIPPDDDARPAMAAKLNAAGIVFQDYVIIGADQREDETREAYWLRKLAAIEPGVNELYVHVARDDEELHAALGPEDFRTGAADRIAEWQLFSQAARLKALLDAQGVVLMRWKDLRDLQRRERVGRR